MVKEPLLTVQLSALGSAESSTVRLVLPAALLTLTDPKMFWTDPDRAGALLPMTTSSWAWAAVGLEAVEVMTSGPLVSWTFTLSLPYPVSMVVVKYGAVAPMVKPFPAVPPAARLAVVVGEPTEPGPYVIRVELPGGLKLMPHVHPEDRVYTVISGVFYIGVGEHFDSEKLESYPPGSVIVLPGGTPHFHWARSGEYVTQVTAIGPLGLEYVDPRDDPRNN